MAFDAAEFEAIYRREVGRCTATLVRVLGDVDQAEDAVAEAFAIAAERWADDGLPPNPGGWITTTARRRAIDRIRRESGRSQREQAATSMYDDDGTIGGVDLTPIDVVPDDQLRLMFLCCHPALVVDAQVALVLRLIGGLTTTEIARAFLVPEPTMGQRLSRAKRKIRDTRMPYRVPDASDLPDRLEGVLAALYLIYNEGHTASSGADLRRPDLVTTSIHLARTVADLLPTATEAAGLLALMLLTEARAPARVDAAGRAVRLPDQDRTAWDRALIDEGQAIVRACIAADRPGPYQIQAAIAAVHADAPVADDTDWQQIVTLYDHLHSLRPTAVVELNRSIAVLHAEGPERALDELGRVDLVDHHLFQATLGETYRRLGRREDARAALHRAIELTQNESQRRDLERELNTL